MKPELTVSRRKLVKTAAVVGAVGGVGGIASAHKEDVDQRKLNELRQATARYHDLEVAKEAGYDFTNGHCESSGDPEVGAMGVHYADPSRITAHPEHDNPQVLVYEPRGEELHLVAVEFLSNAPADGDPPTVLGHETHEFEELPIANWALHAWIWKDNPRGLFADFNPRVECPE